MKKVTKFDENILEKWLTYTQATIENNQAKGLQVFDDEYTLVAYDTEGTRLEFEYTLDGAKALEQRLSLDDLQGYKSIAESKEETLDATLDRLTIGALDDWLSGGGAYIINVDDVLNGEISRELLIDLMDRQRQTYEDLLAYEFIWCGTYTYETKALSDLEDLYTSEEWESWFETGNSLYNAIMDYAGY